MKRISSDDGQLVYLDSSNWRALKKFGADLATDLNSSSGTEPSDGNWKVINTGELKWDIYHPSIQALEGEGAPLEIEVQNQDEYNEGNPSYFVLGHNRVKQLNSTKVIMKFDSYPKLWPIEKLVAEVANWLRDAKNKISETQQELQPSMTSIQPPPPGGGMGGLPPLASRRARLAYLLGGSQ